jgi:uncharacterized protein YcbK (DUF882 family)
MRGIIGPTGRLFGERSARHVSSRARPKGRKSFFHAAFVLGTAAGALAFTTGQTQNAVANGDTRSLSFFHTHTRESATVTFRRNGQYDEQALTQLNWLLRDWRVDKPIKMDPRLFDVLWEVHRESGSNQPINIISAYRSPETNGALRRRSKAVSEHSQHMLGKAMDVRLPDVSTERLREIAMKMQYGGVGYYGASAFVHIDTGSVRAWPRMTQQQLARLFPDGKTLHLPSNGKPLSGYELARAEIPARNAAMASQASAGGGSIGGLFASLFGRKEQLEAPAPAPAAAAPTVLAYASPEGMETIDAVLPPLPPQRPRNLLIPAEAPPTPVANETKAAALAPAVPFMEMDPVKALFEPRTDYIDIGFSSQMPEELSTTQFTGPAVKPLPVLKQAKAEL